jgi:hypothetical protein
VVERSYDARSFEAIDRVEGNGNSSEVLHYNYTDTHIAKGTKLVYYRLHQFDYNGASEYSDVRIVHFDEAKNLEIAAYPNPFSKEVTLSANTNEEYSVVVTDINGVTLLNLENGDRSSHKLDLKSWASGIYFISVTSKQGTKHLKIVKK